MEEAELDNICRSCGCYVEDKIVSYWDSDMNYDDEPKWICDYCNTEEALEI